MQRSRSQVESARVKQQEAILAGCDGSEFRKADVVADSYSDLAIVGEIDEGDLIAWGEDVGFFEGDFAGNVDVEEVHFSMRGHQVPLWRKEKGGIMVFLSRGHIFRYAASEEVSL